MKGAEIFYVVPTAEGGWRLLRGTILNIHATQILVREKNFGIRYTIDPTWLVCYIWKIVPDCSKDVALETSEVPSATA